MLLWHFGFHGCRKNKRCETIDTLLAITGQFIPRNRRRSGTRIRPFRKQMLINKHKVNRCKHVNGVFRMFSRQGSQHQVNIQINGNQVMLVYEIQEYFDMGKNFELQVSYLGKNLCFFGILGKNFELQVSFLCKNLCFFSILDKNFEI